MSKLFILSGPQGAGKSTFIKENELEPFTISSDNIRLLLAGIEQNIEGSLTISQKQESKVWDFLYKVFNQKIQEKSHIVIDATNVKEENFINFVKIAKSHQYQIYFVDFNPFVTLENLLLRNEKRENYKKVPTEIIQKFFLLGQQVDLKKYGTVIYPNEFLQHFYETKTLDLSHYEEIVHFGDIHGCIEPIKEYFEKHPYAENKYYIFLGDYIDRGIQNGKTLNYLFNLVNKPNVCFLEGNHERYLKRLANKDSSVFNYVNYSKEFLKFTLPDIDAAGITEKKLKSFVFQLKSHMLYRYDDKTVIVTHGGISKLDNLSLLKESTFINGVGTHATDVDMIFNLNHQNDNIYQVHGHRNLKEYKINEFSKSFNLEGKIEYGKPLRILSLDKKGFNPLLIENQIYNKERFKLKSQQNKEVSLLVEKLRENQKTIKESHLGNEISSFNFNRNTFRENIWNEITTKTRGLFIDTKNNEILARGYDKFFNLEERKETEVAYILENYKFPVDIYLKENGFFGLIGYNSEDDELIFTSKSQIVGEHVDYFKELVNLDKETEDNLKYFLRKNNVNMICEINHIEKDPHIIDYETNHVVLLDIVYRQSEFKAYSYSKLLEVYNRLKLDKYMKLKYKVATLNSKKELELFIKKVRTDNQNKIEGYILTDSINNYVKVKTPYYNFWKWCRTQAIRVIKGREVNEIFYDEPIAKSLNLSLYFEKVVMEFKEYAEKGDIPKLRSLLLDYYEKHKENLQINAESNKKKNQYYIRDYYDLADNTYIFKIFHNDEEVYYTSLNDGSLDIRFSTLVFCYSEDFHEAEKYNTEAIECILPFLKLTTEEIVVIDSITPNLKEEFLAMAKMLTEEYPCFF